MRWTWQEFWARVALSGVLTPVIVGFGVLFSRDIPWLVAAVIALVIVFLGELLVDAITGDA